MFLDENTEGASDADTTAEVTPTMDDTAAYAGDQEAPEQVGSEAPQAA